MLYKHGKASVINLSQTRFGIYKEARKRDVFSMKAICLGYI